MTAEELGWWELYAEAEPFGTLQRTHEAAVIASAALSPWSKKPPKFADLFPQLAPAGKAGWVEGPAMVRVAEFLTVAWNAGMPGG